MARAKDRGLGDWLDTSQLAERWGVGKGVALRRAKRRGYPARRQPRPAPHAHLDRFLFRVPPEDLHDGTPEPRPTPDVSPAPAGDTEPDAPPDASGLDPVTEDALDRVPVVEVPPAPEPTPDPEPAPATEPAAGTSTFADGVERAEIAGRVIGGTLGLLLLLLLFTARRPASPPVAEIEAVPAEPTTGPIVRTLL